MRSTERRVEFFQTITELIRLSKSLHDLDFMIIWFHRTENQQRDLYEIGRSKPGKIVTNCDGVIKRSNHQKWIAADLVLIKEGKIVWDRVAEYEILGRIGKDLGLRWGGDWDGDDAQDPTDYDIYHFEYKEREDGD